MYNKALVKKFENCEIQIRVNKDKKHADLLFYLTKNPIVKSVENNFYLMNKSGILSASNAPFNCRYIILADDFYVKSKENIFNLNLI